MSHHALLLGLKFICHQRMRKVVYERRLADRVLYVEGSLVFVRSTDDMVAWQSVEFGDDEELEVAIVYQSLRCLDYPP